MSSLRLVCLGDLLLDVIVRLEQPQGAHGTMLAWTRNAVATVSARS